VFSATDFVAREATVVELLRLLIILLHIVRFVVTFGNSCFALFALIGCVARDTGDRSSPAKRRAPYDQKR
jgi:hypothetical protein